MPLHCYAVQDFAVAGPALLCSAVALYSSGTLCLCRVRPCHAAPRHCWVPLCCALAKHCLTKPRRCCTNSAVPSLCQAVLRHRQATRYAAMRPGASPRHCSAVSGAAGLSLCVSLPHSAIAMPSSAELCPGAALPCPTGLHVAAAVAISSPPKRRQTNSGSARKTHFAIVRAPSCARSSTIP